MQNLGDKQRVLWYFLKWPMLSMLSSTHCFVIELVRCARDLQHHPRILFTPHSPYLTIIHPGEVNTTTFTDITQVGKNRAKNYSI